MSFVRGTATALLIALAIGCAGERREPGKEYWLLVDVCEAELVATDGFGLEQRALRVPDDRDIRLRLRTHDEPIQIAIVDADVFAEAMPGRETQVVFRPEPGRTYDVRYGDRWTSLETFGGAGVGVFTTCCGFGLPEELEDVNEWGELLFTSNGCTACHYVERGRGTLVGPNLAGTFGSVRPLEGGESVLVDEEYLREAILEPDRRVAHGFTDARMPPYALQARPLAALVAYVASLSDPAECAPGCDPELWPDGTPHEADPPCPPPPNRKADLLGGVPRKAMLAQAKEDE